LNECKNLKDCSFCVNLVNKQYYFLNEKYLQEEYKKILEQLKTDSKFKEESILKFRKLLSSSPKNHQR
jgi:hypothetical protein